MIVSVRTRRRKLLLLTGDHIGEDEEEMTVMHLTSADLTPVAAVAEVEEEDEEVDTGFGFRPVKRRNR